MRKTFFFFLFLFIVNSSILNIPKIIEKIDIYAYVIPV